MHDRFELLRTLFGDRLSCWNQLNQGLHVLMPPEVASFACARSHAALKALLKLQASYIFHRAVEGRRGVEGEGDRQSYSKH